MSRSAARLLAAALPLAVFAGCAETTQDPAVIVVAPTLEPPPSDSRRLTREQALEVARGSEDPADSIQSLDSRSFDFELTQSAISWFGEQGVEPAVIDYLRKRAKVDWESLRGDVDPLTPR